MYNTASRATWPPNNTAACEIRPVQRSPVFFCIFVLEKIAGFSPLLLYRQACIRNTAGMHWAQMNRQTRHAGKICNTPSWAERHTSSLLSLAAASRSDTDSRYTSLACEYSFPNPGLGTDRSRCADMSGRRSGLKVVVRSESIPARTILCLSSFSWHAQNGEREGCDLSECHPLAHVSPIHHISHGLYILVMAPSASISNSTF